MEDIEREYLTDVIYLRETQMQLEENFYKPEFGRIEIDLKLTYELQKMETN